MTEPRVFSIVNSDETKSLRKQIDGQEKLSPLLSRELGRYMELVEQSFPDWLDDAQILEIAIKCAEIRKSSASLWWQIFDDYLSDVKRPLTNADGSVPASEALSKAEKLSILSFVDRLGKSPTLETVSRLATAWGL